MAGVNERATSARPRARKAEHACVYCRRSHMTCDNKRPCLRCLKRKIGHLCHDEPRKRPEAPTLAGPAQAGAPVGAVGAEEGSPGQAPAHLAVAAGGPLHAPNGGASSSGPTAQQPHPAFPRTSASTSTSIVGGLGESRDHMGPLFNEQVGSEFSSLNEFLTLMDDDLFANGEFNVGAAGDPGVWNMNGTTNGPANGSVGWSAGAGNVNGESVHGATPGPDVPDVSATEKFMLTAADPADGSAAGRLREVIDAKLRAGLLRPYNYAQGYDRLRTYMDNYMSETSRQRILQPLAMTRPAFRAVAKALNDLDLVMVEEGFERLLLDYDRIFSSMAMPSCLWRRTGEIFRGNREFAELVECRVEELRDGQLAIYELMSEEAAVNYWEKYGSIAFNTDHKAIVTTCNLRTRDGRKRRQCCFSFTIRRDRYNIPICIVGNFIPIQKALV